MNSNNVVNILFLKDGSYVAIIEHKKHVFLYEKPDRKSRIGRQRVIGLEDESSAVLGAMALDKHLILLTKDKLHSLRIF